MASYPISIAIEADLDALVPLMIESYSTNAMDCARFPRPATEANIAWRRKTLGMSLVHDPRAQCLKITDGDRIIAFAMWLAPKSALTPEQQLKLDDYAKMTLGIPEENAANLELYQRMQGMAKGRVMETWPEGHVEVWFLAQLFVDPEYRRRGLAKRLIRHGTAKADEDQVVARLCAAPAGLQTYVSAGFREVNSVELVEGYAYRMTERDPV